MPFYFLIKGRVYSTLGLFFLNFLLPKYFLYLGGGKRSENVQKLCFLDFVGILSQMLRFLFFFKKNNFFIFFLFSFIFLVFTFDTQEKLLQKEVICEKSKYNFLFFFHR